MIFISINCKHLKKKIYKGEFENAPKGGPLWTIFFEVIILVVLQTMIQPRLRTKLSPFSERSPF
jgi:hypothetical protein